MERISVSALRAGMVLPVLQFGGLEAFSTLVEPDAYYVVTAEHPDNSMRLSLAYRNPACARVLTPCLTFEARTFDVLNNESPPDIMTAVSFGATKSTSPTQTDGDDQLYYIKEFIRATAYKGLRIYIGTSSAIQLYCEVDASDLIHSDSKGHTGYTMGLHPNGTFYNRSAKQTLVSISSTHADEMRALYTLVKDILFIIYICSELNIPLLLSAVIMEDNSAVVTVSNEESAYLK
jgi:hypothetical protein